MEQIGFKNFRRFETFPAIALAPITILVGENNAGKSTVVKGILALSDFLNRWTDDFSFIVSEKSTEEGKKEIKKTIIENLKNQKFYFNTSYLAHIGTFKRALYNKAKNNIITFHTRLGLQELTLEISGDKNDDESVSGIISRILINYPSMGVDIVFDLQKDHATITFKPVNPSANQLEWFPQNRRESVRSFLSSISRTYVFEYEISDYYRRFSPTLIFSLIASVEIAISAAMEYEKTNKYIGLEIVNQLRPSDNVDKDVILFLKEYTRNVCVNSKSEEWIFRLPEKWPIGNMFNIEYLYAHAVTQTVIYSAKDTNDYLSRTIHEFASLPKSNNDYRREFIVRWMKEFNIGQDYLITSVGGEAHIVKIINKDKERVNLADKGMGSIQLMVLLFRLAITLPERTLSNKRERQIISIKTEMPRIIIIEEPEQNLHPMLQSKLADLLFRLYEDYGYRFIIETHSEYLIRKTQIIVKNNFKNKKTSLKDNPFKVYYFNSETIASDRPYYEIIYQKDGNFENDFGKGFFDEASNLAFQIL